MNKFVILILTTIAQNVISSGSSDSSDSDGFLSDAIEAIVRVNDFKTNFLDTALTDNLANIGDTYAAFKAQYPEATYPWGFKTDFNFDRAELDLYISLFQPCVAANANRAGAIHTSLFGGLD